MLDARESNPVACELPVTEAGEGNEPMSGQLVDEMRRLIKGAPTREAAGVLTPDQQGGLLKSELLTTLQSTDGEPIELPVASIIGLPGIDDWNRLAGKKDRGYIRKLARGGDLSIISGTALVYIQPNGMVLTKLLNNGAHTVLAAIRSREQFVELHGEVALYGLKENIFDLLNKQPEKLSKRLGYLARRALG